MNKENQRVFQNGQGGELFLIMLVNFFLKLITLGIYYFWAKTRVRRYLWSQTSIDGERLQYTGTGGELFVGFLKAMGFCLLIFLGVGVIGGGIMAALPESAANVASNILAFGFMVGIAVVFGAVAYQARRYLLTRTHYRSIRCGLSGSAWYFGAQWVGAAILMVLSLGLAVPWARMQLAHYMLNNHYFGSERLRFAGKAEDLYPYYLVCWVLALPTLGLTLLAYRLKEARYVASCLELGGMRTEFNIRFWPFIGLMLTNYLLLVVTLGLAWPWIMLRNLRFLLERVSLYGELDYNAIRQDMERGDALGEGAADGLEAAFG